MQTYGSSGDVFNSNVTTENKIVKSGRTRAHGIVLNTTGTAGDFHLKDGGASGTVKFKYKTTGTASGASPLVINFPGPILFKTDVYSAFTTEQITAITVFHSGGSNA